MKVKSEIQSKMNHKIVSFYLEILTKVGLNSPRFRLRVPEAEIFVKNKKLFEIP